ncbi:MAG: alkaline phosphatase family protein, partial [Elusimicrobia bacterium]|nr:alkaline phosphatase family protein [Elusimicrobiota bacterium]
LLPATCFSYQPPKLVVLIVVDQMRADYLDRFKPYFGKNGFLRLAAEGSVFEKAFYEHHTTQTGPGHALLGSGIYGYKSGIVGNDWYDRKSQKHIYCAEDSTIRSSSPVYFEAKSLAQRIKEKYPTSRVIAAAHKDRSSILLAGPGADAAYWFDNQKENFVSSDYYDYNPKVLAFDAQIKKRLENHPVWNYSLQQPPATICPQDDPEFHRDYLELGKAFPHPIKNPKAFAFNSPWGNDLLADFVEHILRRENLGRNPTGAPDILGISFSVTDYVGHSFGPDSCEVADTYVQLDKTIERVISLLEKQVGRKNLALLLTSDHGVAPIPELLQKQGKNAGRIILEDPHKASKISELPPLRLQIEEAASKAFRYPWNPEAPLSESFIASFQEPGLYLNTTTLRRKKIAFSKAKIWLKNYLFKQPGIKATYTQEEIYEKAPRSLRYSVRKDRSGDILLALRPYWIFSDNIPGGTNHGEFHDYDTQVPLIIWGGMIRPQIISKRISTAQVSPTVAYLLDLSFEDFNAAQPLIR